MAFSIFDLLKRVEEEARKKKEALKSLPLLQFLHGGASRVTDAGEKVGKRPQELPQPTTAPPERSSSPLFDLLLGGSQTLARRPTEAPVLPFTPGITPKSIAQFATRKPNAYGALDPGSLYGYVATQPRTSEAQKEIAQDIALQFLGGAQSLKQIGRSANVAEGLREVLGRAKSPSEAVQAVKRYVAEFRRGADTRQLADLRAGLSKELTLLTGGSGNYKMDYAMRVALRDDTQIGPLVRGIEDAVFSLDETLKKQVPELRTTGRGSYTNVVAIDNPLLRNIYGPKPSPQQVKTALEIQKPPDVNLKDTRFYKEVLNIEKSLETKTPTPVEKKVNLLDYFRTPDRVMDKIGLGFEARQLRSSYERYKQALPEEVKKITAWASQLPEASNVRIFRYLDGQPIKLQPDEYKVAKEVKNYLADWAVKLKLPKENQISRYITHLFEPDIIKKEFDEDLAKIIAGQVPGRVYDPFLQKRTNAPGYIEDTWRALNAYVKRATRKFYMDPALEKIKEKAKDLELSQANYVKHYTQHINLRPTDTDTLIDNFIKVTPIGYRFGQRPVNALSQSVRQAVYRGTLGLNVTTALKNLTQGANTYAKLGEVNTIKGYVQLLKNWGGDELTRIGVLDDAILQDRRLPVIKQTIDRVDKVLWGLFDTAEKINRGAAFFGAKAKALSQGKTVEEAVEYAKKIVRDTQFTFGAIDTPVALQSDIAKTLAQFQTFGLKQAEFLAEMVKDKEWAGIIRWIGASLAMVYVVGDTIGMDVKDLIPFQGILSGETRFGETPAIKAVRTGLQAAFGEGEKREEAVRELIKTGRTFIPGGVQAAKTIEGIKAFREGASLTPTGRVRFEIPQNFPTALKTVLFGPWSLPQAREYFERRESGKSKAELLHQELKVLPREEANQRAFEIKKENPQLFSELLRVIKDEKIGATDDEKRIRSLPVNNRSRIRAIQKEMKSLTRGERRERFDRLVQLGIITQDVYKQYMELFQKGEL